MLNDRCVYLFYDISAAILNNIIQTRWNGQQLQYGHFVFHFVNFQQTNNCITLLEPGIAAGLIDAYLAHSNARKTIPKSDFIQYIQDLDEEKNHDLDLSACPGIEMKSEISFDLLTVGYALQHNTYFKYVFLLNDRI